ncbi:patatin-like phospholipase family protein [Candidatus Kaiserbacteria bacterium]|nr:patatin-like phospholipase family protein [Candidatus Kaiserbacteria bacterium]
MRIESGKKIAIICSGGGMRCAYSAGALMALVEKYKLTEPHLVIGSSGSAGTVAYFAAKQFDEIKNVWLNLLSTKKLVSVWRIWNIIDIDYLVDIIFKKEARLKVELLGNASTKYFIGIRNLENGLVEHYSNDRYSDIFEVLRASKTMPLISRDSVIINGNRYIDGFMGSNINSSVKKAKEEGADVMIMIDNSSIIKSKTEFIFLRIYALLTPGHMGSILKNYLYNDVKNKILLKDKNIIYIKPRHGLYASMFNNKKTRLKRTYEMGYDNVIRNKEIQSLFS